MCKRIDHPSNHSSLQSRGVVEFALSLTSRYKFHLAALGGLAFCVAVAVRDPRASGNYPTCPWLSLTGTHCPGCGTMRSVNRLVDLDLAGAIEYNLLTVLITPFVVYAIATGILRHHFSIAFPNVASLNSKVILGIAGAFVLFWFLRNLPLEPFNWLAPASG